VSHQRQAKKKEKLNQERIHRLENVGFTWVRKRGGIGGDEKWKEKYAELQSYREIYGDCNVPGKWPENEGLGIWVGNQRQTKKKRRLSQERIAKLDAIGFVWARRKTS